MHTKDMLAEALNQAGLPELAVKATEGWFHDYLSPLDFPEMALVEALTRAATPQAMALRERVIDGEFDASTEEGDEWLASPDGQEAMASLVAHIPEDQAAAEATIWDGTPLLAKVASLLGDIPVMKVGGAFTAGTLETQQMIGAVATVTDQLLNGRAGGEREEEDPVRFITFLALPVKDENAVSIAAVSNADPRIFHRYVAEWLERLDVKPPN